MAPDKVQQLSASAHQFKKSYPAGGFLQRLSLKIQQFQQKWNYLLKKLKFFVKEAESFPDDVFFWRYGGFN